MPPKKASMNSFRRIDPSIAFLQGVAARMARCADGLGNPRSYEWLVSLRELGMLLAWLAG